MSTHNDARPAQISPALPDPRRWLILAVLALAQMMVVVDTTIMNIALPSAQRGLEMSDPARQWVITIFALAFGGLLLLGGRLSDLIGRKQSLLIGLAGFAAASALGGAAVNPAMLLISRALQGAFGALLVPSVLALLAATFPAPAERGKAFGIFATVMGSGTGIGVMLGGILTDYLDWRWCMYVNVPIAIVAGIGVALAAHPTPRVRGVHLDITGAVLSTSGLVALVFGFARAQVNGWTAGITLGSLAAGVVLLVAFVWSQTRVASPLLPLRVVLDRRRGGSYLAVFAWGVGTIGSFFFLSFYLQNVLGFSPVKTGFAFLPFTIAIMIGVRLVSRFVMRAPVRSMLVPGIILVAIGMALLGQLGVDSRYATEVLPIFLVIGLGTSLILVPANSTATLNTGPDTAVAGAMVSTSQQIGASLGIAVLSTIAGSATADFARSHALDADIAARAAVHGYSVASLTGALLLCLAALAVFVITGPTSASSATNAAPQPAPPVVRSPERPAISVGSNAGE